MISLLLEGGGFRGVFTQGVLDALLDENIFFSYIIGVSAGICNAYSYVSRQKGRNWQIAEKYYRDKRYYGYRNLWRHRSLFGLDFMFETIPNELLPYDYEALKAYDGKIIAGVTHGPSGTPRYFEQTPCDRTNRILRATCAIPFFFPPVEMGGEKYFDGGMADPIPVEKAISHGQERHLIVLTQPKGYRKELSRGDVEGAKLLRKSYPGTAAVLLKRHENYNRQVLFCESLVQQGKAVILQPQKGKVVRRFERDIAKLRLLYEDGYQTTKANIEAIAALF